MPKRPLKIDGQIPREYREWLESVLRREHLTAVHVRFDRGQGWRGTAYNRAPGNDKPLITLPGARVGQLVGETFDYPRVRAFMRRHGINLNEFDAIRWAALHEVAHILVYKRKPPVPSDDASLQELEDYLNKLNPKAHGKLFKRIFLGLVRRYLVGTS